MTLKVKASLGNLGVDDVRIELLLGVKENMSEEFVVKTHHLLNPEPGDNTEIFALSVPMENCGLLYYKVCIYPYHELLAHPFEMGFMKWL